jgi:hypothetical protein
MMIRRMTALKLAAAGAIALAVASGASAHSVRAQVPCPLSAGTCVFVNSNADTNARDERVTLREALLVASGDLPTGQLTDREQLQVVQVGDSEPPKGLTNIYFDPTIFCSTCPTNRIVLTPPGFEGNGILGYKGTKIVTLPPIRKAAGKSAPPGTGGSGILSVQIGMGYDPVAGEVPARVTLDGSRLSSAHAGLWFEGGGWIRGITFQDFAGHAVEINEDVLDSVEIGVMSIMADGESPAAVRFKNNGADVSIVKP